MTYFFGCNFFLFNFVDMFKICSPLVDGHLLLILVTDNEPDNSSEPADQVEQGQHQPHHVNLGENVISLREGVR